MYMYMYVYMCVCICICVSRYMCAYVYLCAWTFTYMCMTYKCISFIYAYFQISTFILIVVVFMSILGNVYCYQLLHIIFYLISFYCHLICLYL